MILLRHDCLVFKTTEGDFPFAAEEVMMEVIGDALQFLDEETIKHAAEAVLHYFKCELGKTTVTIGEFTIALERALRALGLNVQSASSQPAASNFLPSNPRIVESDLSQLAPEADLAMELMFFSKLRKALQELLDQSPDVVRFRGLRPCVKQMLKARRWTNGCKCLNDQIVEYLRTCFGCDRRAAACALVVS
jgi:hypothetical protein